MNSAKIENVRLETFSATGPQLTSNNQYCWLLYASLYSFLYGNFFFKDETYSNLYIQRCFWFLIY